MNELESYNELNTVTLIYIYNEMYKWFYYKKKTEYMWSCSII